MSKKSNNKTPMTRSAAARIQSNADKTGNNQDFKARAQRAAEKHSSNDESAAGTSGGKKE